MAYRIMIADDEAEIRNLLRLYLEQEGYEIVEANTGVEALDLVKNEHVDLCVLDLMMPEMDGYQVLKNIRQDNNIPVIILSAKTDDSDKILGLKLGADDYITKPFNPLEAVARIESNLRRFYTLGSDASESSTYSVGDLSLDTLTCEFKKGSEAISLTSTEYKIMELLMSTPGKVYTKQQLYEVGWGEKYYISDNNIMVCMSKLRSKLDDDDQQKYIENIRGLGYRLRK